MLFIIIRMLFIMLLTIVKYFKFVTRIQFPLNKATENIYTFCLFLFEQFLSLIFNLPLPPGFVNQPQQESINVFRHLCTRIYILITICQLWIF